MLSGPPARLRVQATIAHAPTLGAAVFLQPWRLVLDTACVTLLLGAFATSGWLGGNARANVEIVPSRPSSLPIHVMKGLLLAARITAGAALGAVASGVATIGLQGAVTALTRAHNANDAHMGADVQCAATPWDGRLPLLRSLLTPWQTPWWVHCCRWAWATGATATLMLVATQLCAPLASWALRPLARLCRVRVGSARAVLALFAVALGGLTHPALSLAVTSVLSAAASYEQRFEQPSHQAPSTGQQWARRVPWQVRARASASAWVSALLACSFVAITPCAAAWVRRGGVTRGSAISYSRDAMASLVLIVLMLPALCVASWDANDSSHGGARDGRSGRSGGCGECYGDAGAEGGCEPSGDSGSNHDSAATGMRASKARHQVARASRSPVPPARRSTDATSGDADIRTQAPPDTPIVTPKVSRLTALMSIWLGLAIGTVMCAELEAGSWWMWAIGSGSGIRAVGGDAAHLPACDGDEDGASTAAVLRVTTIGVAFIAIASFSCGPR